jgi:hypothetical protein
MSLCFDEPGVLYVGEGLEGSFVFAGSSHRNNATLHAEREEDNVASHFKTRAATRTLFSYK